MALLGELTRKLLSLLDLTPAEVTAAASALADATVAEADKAAFLLAWADKGETPAEIAALALAFRAWALDPGVEAWAAEAIDIVGTGGDHAGGFNISSLVTLTLACAGVPVMKHGNRGITSKCGSADLLAGLGVQLDAPPERQREALATLGYVFFFAPAYHPAFKQIGPVRRQLAAQGRRTVFNVLGPLLNPGRPGHLLLGVYAAPWTTRLAAALDLLATPAGLVVHGVLDAERGIDELTTATPNRIQGLGRLQAHTGLWHAGDFGLPTAAFADLAGGDLAYNLSVVEALLAGRGPRGLVDTISLNTATALWITGRQPSVVAGLPLARELLLGGAVKAKIKATREFFHS